jgi:hypothetical protein
MMWYDKVLERLDGVVSCGEERWKAKCNVHEDSSPSLNITVKDRKLLMHCFSCGAKGDSVVESMGLKVSDLFQDQREYKPDPNFMLKKTQEEDDMFIPIYQAAKAKGEIPCHSDYKLYQVAMSRRRQRQAKGIYQNIVEVKGFNEF